MECFLVVLKLTAKISHPVDVELSRVHIVCPRIEPFSKSLALDQTVKDTVHGHFRLELLIRCADTGNKVLSKSCNLTVTTSCSLLDRSLILKSTACRAVAHITVEVVLEELGLSMLALQTLKFDLCTCRFPLGIILQLLCFLRGLREVDQLLLCSFLGRGSEAHRRWGVCSFVADTAT